MTRFDYEMRCYFEEKCFKPGTIKKRRSNRCSHKDVMCMGNFPDGRFIYEDGSHDYGVPINICDGVLVTGEPKHWIEDAYEE